MSRVATASSAFGARHFTLVWLSGLIWHLTRWGVAFLGTFLVNELTGSPRLVQLAGTMLYAPLLVGGVLGGVVSDRLDRLTTVRVQLAVLIPLSVAIGLLVRADRASIWIIYLYMFLVGIGWVTDMTSRRALVFDLVGDRRIDHAMAMESLSLSSGMVLGALVGGSAVGAVGVGSAYFFIAGLLALSLLLLVPVSSPDVVHRPGAGAGEPQPETGSASEADPGPGAGSPSPIRDIVDGFRVLRAQRGVFGILGVTVIANFFLFAYFPIIPVVAERLDASPVLVGLLSAATGIGMMTGSLIMARLAPRQRGMYYTMGLFIAFFFVVPFGRGTSFALVLASLICAGVGAGFFGATQTTLVLAAAPQRLRGRALGLLSMAIGALPVGMYALGELAERIGVPDALTLNAIVGAAVLAAWSIRRPEVRRMTVAGAVEPVDPVDPVRTGN